MRHQDQRQLWVLGTAAMAVLVSEAVLWFIRRWLVAPFTRTFEEGAEGTLPRKVIDATLADPQELSGVLNKALAALPRIGSSL